MSNAPDQFGKSLTCEDFRGITISNTFSKLFEKCCLVVFQDYFATEAAQFGFKRGLGCSHAIYAARRVIEFYVAGSSTANICALDVAKAFPSVNHAALFSKLMRRQIPVCLLSVLENWYADCTSCVKWDNLFSKFFPVETGVMQGSCLAPALFAICINAVISSAVASGSGYILVYADDILLIARSIACLQHLLSVVEHELAEIDLRLNVSKSYCLRIGPRAAAACADIVTSSGLPVAWRPEIKYLGVCFVSGCSFRCSMDGSKRAFNRAANSVIGKLGNKSSSEVVLQLLMSKCMPILLYGTEACNLTKAAAKSLDFTFVKFLYKIFATRSYDVVQDCITFFDIRLPSVATLERAQRFNVKVLSVENALLGHINILSSCPVGGCDRDGSSI